MSMTKNTKQKLRRKISSLLCLVLLVSLSLPPFYPVQAADSECIAGLPCVTNATPNDPFEDGDGPNFEGENISKSTSQACDADFMNQIYARAFIEAEREIVDGQIVIRKPDSVMEYTCFDQIVGMTASVGAPLFSESTEWAFKMVPLIIGGEIVFVSDDLLVLIIGAILGNYMGPQSMSGVLNDLVLAGLSDYQSSNFSHDFLGGYAEGQDHTLSGSGFGSGYNCTAMNDIYSFAKCDDFATDDRFFSFENLTTLDPRQLPESCGDSTSITTALIALANNDGFQHVNFDPVVTHTDLMTASGNAECPAPPIPTGVLVERDKIETDMFGNANITGTEEYVEAICPNPDCHYVRANGKGSCTK